MEKKIKVVRNEKYQYGVTDQDGNVIVPFGKYEFIDGFDHGLARVRGKGLLFYPKQKRYRFDSIEEWLNADPNAVPIDQEKDRKEHPELYSKWGIINERGEEVLPVEYDSIWKFLGKGRTSTKVEKGGISSYVDFLDLLTTFEPGEDDEQDNFYENYEEEHYEEFAGTYAQEVEGCSDEFINIVLEGDPDLYWNID